MTNKDFDRELEMAQQCIFQVYCMMELAKSRFIQNMKEADVSEDLLNEYIKTQVHNEVVDDFGFMLDYITYGIISELELYKPNEFEVYSIVKDCVENNLCLRGYFTFDDNYDDDLRKEMKAMGFTESTIKYDDEK